MKVAVDSKIFSIQKFGGISRYFYNIIDRSKNEVNIDLRVSAPLYINEYLNSSSCKFLGRSKKVEINNKLRRPLKYLNEFLSIKEVNKFSPDIIHETYYSAFYPYSKNSKRIITIHDLIDYEFSNSFPLHNFNKIWKSKAINSADHIICVSNFTKEKLNFYFNIPENKISVIHHGVDPPLKDITTQDLDLPFPYLLYVGQRWGYKNFINFIEAYSKSKYLKKNFKIICFGGGNFSNYENKNFHSKDIQNHVIHLSGDDSVLSNLYKNATAFIYPSISEGFGFPILEALNNHCPVIASNGGSIPEILGNHGIYFDPNNIESIISTLETSLFDLNFLANNLKLTKYRCEHFRIDKSVSDTFNCYRKIIEC